MKGDFDLLFSIHRKTPHTTTPCPQKINRKVIKEATPKTPEDLNTTFTIEEDSIDDSIPQLLTYSQLLTDPEVLTDDSEIITEKLNDLLEKLKQVCLSLLLPLYDLSPILLILDPLFKTSASQLLLAKHGCFVMNDHYSKYRLFTLVLRK